MATTAKSTRSKKRSDLKSQRTPSVGFSNLLFAHEATAGDRIIDLTNLNPPSGAIIDDVSKLVAARINDYRRSLRLFNGSGKRLLEGVSYAIRGNTKIELLSDPSAFEIFIGEIDAAPNTGLQVVGTKRILRTGTITANATDINVGDFFPVGDNLDEQVGAVMLFVSGVQFMRNDGNVDSATVLAASGFPDGNYQEIDAGAGFGTLLRLNTDETSGLDRSYIVIGTSNLVDNPEISTFDQLERHAGIIDRMADQLADTSGKPKQNFLAGAPSNALLKAFGDTVLAMLDAEVPIVTPWTSFTMVPDAVTTAPTKGTSGYDIWYKRRNGQNLEITGTYKQTIAGTNGSGVYLFPLPDGLSCDTAIVKTVAATAVEDDGTEGTLIGIGHGHNGNITPYPVYAQMHTNNTHFWMFGSNAGTNYNEVGSAAVFAYGTAAQEWSVKLSIPIAGWSATQTLRTQLGL